MIAVADRSETEMRKTYRLEVAVAATVDSEEHAAETCEKIRRDLESIIYMDCGAGYCCE